MSPRINGHDDAPVYDLFPRHAWRTRRQRFFARLRPVLIVLGVCVGILAVSAALAFALLQSVQR